MNVSLASYSLPLCSFVQQHIRWSMTTRGAIRRDSIVTHLSSSCIISSYFWMTLAPSGDSRHLAEKMRFHEASGRLFPISSKWPILQNIVLLHRIWKCHRSDNRSRCMTRAKLFFFFLSFAFLFFFMRRVGGYSRVGEECEFGEGSLDPLLQFLGPSEASCNRWHVLTHCSPACKSRQSLLTHTSHSLVSYHRSSISLLTERGCLVFIMVF